MMERNEKRGISNGTMMIGRIGTGFSESVKTIRRKADQAWIGLRYFSEKEDEGIDGILVTVGLCIIALLLCVVMKDSLSDFIKTIVKSMQTEAGKILSGNGV